MSQLNSKKNKLKMLDQLLKMAEGPLKEALAGVNSEKSPAAMNIVKDTVVSSLKNQVAKGDLGIVKEMFSGKSTDGSNPLLSVLTGDVSQNLISKLGLDASTAASMAKAAIPMLMNLYNQKINDAPQANDDIMSSVIDTIKGGSGGGMGSMLGTILGGAIGGKSGVDLGGLMNMGKGLFGK